MGFKLADMLKTYCVCAVLMSRSSDQASGSDRVFDINEFFFVFVVNCFFSDQNSSTIGHIEFKLDMMVEFCIRSNKFSQRSISQLLRKSQTGRNFMYTLKSIVFIFSHFITEYVNIGDEACLYVCVCVCVCVWVCVCLSVCLSQHFIATPLGQF